MYTRVLVFRFNRMMGWPSLHSDVAFPRVSVPVCSVVCLSVSVCYCRCLGFRCVLIQLFILFPPSPFIVYYHAVCLSTCRPMLKFVHLSNDNPDYLHCVVSDQLYRTAQSFGSEGPQEKRQDFISYHRVDLKSPG